MRKKIILACVQCQNRNYSTVKKVSSETRFDTKKFCKHCNAHTDHRETK